MSSWRLGLDIETAPNWEHIAKYPEEAAAFCERRKCELEDLGLYPQWGKIVAVGYGTKPESVDCMAGPEELHCLGVHDGQDDELAEMLNDPDVIIVGHNIKKFDIPYLALRYMANGRTVPKSLRVAGKKPWELVHIDTMELLQFGGYGTMSLGDACLLFGIPTPKGELCGKHVDALVKAGEFGKVRSYCCGDVRADMALYRRLVELKGV